MSRQKAAGPKLTAVAHPDHLAPWERRALAALRSMSAEGREVTLRVNEVMARRDVEERTARPGLRLLQGGRA